MPQSGAPDGVTPFEDYVSSLGRLSAHVDPTATTPESLEIREAADQLTALESICDSSVAAWLSANPQNAFVCALAVGISREKFKNQIRDWFGTASWVRLAVERADELVDRMDREYDLLRLLTVQRSRTYSFGDILVARAGTRVTATSAGRSGRRVEDEIEAIAQAIGLPYVVRTRFEGRGGRTAPADLAVPGPGRECRIAVAAKGFDSTGSKLTDAVREIKEMADARSGRQVVLAVVDGIGWKGRISDLHRIWELWDSGDIDGLYTLATLDRFKEDLQQFAAIHRIEVDQPGARLTGAYPVASPGPLRLG